MDKVSEIAKMIDHSLLHPTLTDEELREGCEFAKKHKVASVCIKPYAVRSTAALLKGSDVRVGTVVGFPHGNSLPELKANEAELACQEGAVELDMVVNIGKVLSEKWDYIEAEIKAVNDVANKYEAILKVIFENDFLPEDKYKIKLCEICSKVKVAFVKTSTGYGFVKGDDNKYSYKGATDHDLELMRKHCSPEVQVKAAGGLRTLDDVLRVKEMGVTRIGASATEAILREAKRRFRE
ncbi:MAG: deoxyribose-phosphate aldolase [Candidatus Aminicenantes bacterium]|nr:deoxyribose-phosphate aldolase [Candidatus Aminicenantes bacterium]